MAGQVPSFWPFSAALLWFDGSVTKKVSFEEEAMEEFSAKREWMKITGSVWQEETGNSSFFLKVGTEEG